MTAPPQRYWSTKGQRWIYDDMNEDEMLDVNVPLAGASKADLCEEIRSLKAHINQLVERVQQLESR